MLTSVVGTRNLLRLAEATGARFLLASTSEVYGDPDVHPQREAYWGNVNPTGPRACYDEGKRAAEALAFDYARMQRAEVRVARIFNTYGPRMRADDGRVVSNVVTQALAGATSPSTATAARRGPSAMSTIWSTACCGWAPARRRRTARSISAIRMS